MDAMAGATDSIIRFDPIFAENADMDSRRRLQL